MNTEECPQLNKLKEIQTLLNRRLKVCRKLTIDETLRRLEKDLIINKRNERCLVLSAEETVTGVTELLYYKY